MSSTGLLADLQPEADDSGDPALRLKNLKADLQAAKEERARLERLHDDRVTLRFRLDSLESEEKQAKEEHAALVKKVEAEERRKKEQNENLAGNGRRGSNPKAAGGAAKWFAKMGFAYDEKVGAVWCASTRCRLPFAARTPGWEGCRAGPVGM